MVFDSIIPEIQKVTFSECKPPIQLIVRKQNVVSHIFVSPSGNATIVAIVSNEEFLSTKNDIEAKDFANAVLRNVRKRLNSRQELSDINIKIVVVSNGKTHYIKIQGEYSKNNFYSISGIEGLISDVLKNCEKSISEKKASSKPKKPTLQEFVKKLNRIFQQYLKEQIINTDFFDQEITTKDGFFYLSDKDEDALFLHILKTKKPSDLVYRYMPLSSFMRNIQGNINDTRKESMCGLVGMNDKDECSFAKSKLLSGNYNKSSIPNRSAFNNYYIVSFSNKKDDLTMWRLYGDDGKGVCVVYKDYNATNNFDYACVSYEGTTSYKTLMKISQIKINNYRLVLRRLNLWSLFIKSKDYRIEDEVRLLYHHGSVSEGCKNSNPEIKWILNSSYNIVHPIALFDVCWFPLSIEKVILGPNITEPDVNKVQIETLLKLKGLKNISVDLSAKEDYRSSK